MSALHDVAAGALRILDPETAHKTTIQLLRTGLGPRAARGGQPRLAIDLCGLKLENAVGLAAGFDKDAETPDAMLAAGFGFVECGTVTPLPQVAGRALYVCSGSIFQLSGKPMNRATSRWVRVRGWL